MAMIPEVARVVEAARAFLAGPLDGSDGSIASLEDAVAALDARAARPAGLEPVMEEQERTWGDVVVGDEILSTKTQRWYPVSRTSVDDKAGTVRINIKGNPKPITRPLGDPVRLRRGMSGEAVDTFMILWSAQSRSESVDAQGIEPQPVSQEGKSDG